MKKMFLTVCSLGVLTCLPANTWAQDRPKPGSKKPTSKYETPWELIKGEHDKNKDGEVSAKEYKRGKERFARLDKNKDGKLTSADFESSKGRPGRGRRRGQRGRMGQGRPMAPELGTLAPDFQLKSKDGRKKVRLSTFKGKKPVALIFGSYT